MATITLIFVGLWFAGGARVTIRPRSSPKAFAAGLASGITTMVAHSGGPPLAMYLLPLGLSKDSLYRDHEPVLHGRQWLRKTSSMIAATSLIGTPLKRGWKVHFSFGKRGANVLDATLEARVTKALGTNKGHSLTSRSSVGVAVERLVDDPFYRRHFID